METFKKNFEGTWKCDKAKNENMEQYATDAGVPDDEAKFYIESSPTFTFTVQGDGSIHTTSIPYPEKTEIKMESRCNLGKEYEFIEPLKQKVIKNLMTMDGEKLIHTLTSPAQDQVKKTKMVYTRVGNTIVKECFVVEDSSKKMKRVFNKV